jgi:hypothetical protein
LKVESLERAFGAASLIPLGGGLGGEWNSTKKQKKVALRLRISQYGESCENVRMKNATFRGRGR